MMHCTPCTAVMWAAEHTIWHHSKHSGKQSTLLSFLITRSNTPNCLPSMRYSSVSFPSLFPHCIAESLLQRFLTPEIQEILASPEDQRQEKVRALNSLSFKDGVAVVAMFNDEFCDLMLDELKNLLIHIPTTKIVRITHCLPNERLMIHSFRISKDSSWINLA